MAPIQMIKDYQYLSNKFGEAKNLKKVLTTEKFIDFILKKCGRTEIFASIIQSYKDDGSVNGKIPKDDKGFERIIKRWKFEGLIS